MSLDNSTERQILHAPIHDAPHLEEDTTPVKRPGLLDRLPITGRTRTIVEWFSVVFAVYILITAVSVIGSGFGAATGGRAEEIFSFAQNPVVGLVIGILATVLTQSSSTTTSIVVGLVAGGLPLGAAIPILMGANVGTTMTSTLVSLGAAGDRNQFRRAFTAASVHDMYNLLSVAIFFPLEWAFGILDRVSTWFAGATMGSDGGVIATVFTGLGNAVTAVTDPGADLVEASLLGLMPPMWAGLAMIVLGVAGILLVIRFISSMLKVLLVGNVEKVFHSAIGRGPISGIFSGLLITVMVQSSSTTTSLAVPLAASGKFSIWQIYPFTVGANIGTTMTAMIAAFGFSGSAAAAAMTAAAVHLFYNLFSALVIFCVPFLRPLPVIGATWLGNLGAKNKLYVVAWLAGLFVVLPAIMIGISSLF
ncbi:Na/Pi cotransporter family protein [Enteractinococcus coprophilus]|uniref:Sodium-dependent phosphate cotransporter n=1 Tax=Enteractinococcus coprophilus TaxID=1027633 RepID=A0A543AIG8_9MICC|nr:Na/Pi cotransporter family protein [Enteractinococcus coprophilus]TQL72368.1 sodium-dependent phosphate cotransporter [Enteractinococcus coprophilus]